MDNKTPESANVEAGTELLGVIDIGSNSIRMVIGQLGSDDSIEVIEKAQRTVRLGQDAFCRHQLEQGTMRAAVAILREFKRRFDSYQVKHVWTVATSAVRESSNADIFIDRVLMATGLEVNVLNGSLEGRLIVASLRAAFNSAAPSVGMKTLITEVGGGSTIFTVLVNGQIESSQSLGLGSIRLQEVLGTNELPSQQAADLTRDEIVSVISSVQSAIPLSRITTFFAVGSDARFAASRVGTPMDNPAFTKVRRNDLGKLIKHMQGLSMERIATDCGLSYAEAETLVPALMVYQELLRATKAKFIIVSPVTMRDGLLLELSRRCRGQQDATFGNEVLQSAEAIAEKYNTNLEHARKVAACSVVLYDELQPEHLLGNRHRILLEAAALLHEIGVYVAARAYHKHTYYLIVNSQLYGLTSMEVMLVAQIARYHRRSTPKPSHVEYTNLSRENRVIVNKLAAILRLAKTLDSSGMCDVDQLKCKLAGDKFLVRVAGLTDVSLRRHLLDVRSDYFEDVYGLTLEFEQG